MSIEHKPLFRPEALRPHLANFEPPPAARAARPKLAHWAALLASKQAAGMKETELRDEFLYDVFRDLLGYTTPTQTPDLYTFKKEAAIQADGTFAAAAFGRFAAADRAFVAVLEGKGPGDPLDKPYKSRKRSAVEQAVLYALQLKVDWYLVTNLRETRLYSKRNDTAHFESFQTARLAADDAKLIDVEILGHIFEQSISGLEELREQVAPRSGVAERSGPTKRKLEGAFYTPEFVTRYIVAETLGPVLRERFEAAEW